MSSCGRRLPAVLFPLLLAVAAWSAEDPALRALQQNQLQRQQQQEQLQLKMQQYQGGLIVPDR